MQLDQVATARTLTRLIAYYANRFEGSHASKSVSVIPVERTADASVGAASWNGGSESIERHRKRQHVTCVGAAGAIKLTTRAAILKSTLGAPTGLAMAMERQRVLQAAVMEPPSAAPLALHSDDGAAPSSAQGNALASPPSSAASSPAAVACAPAIFSRLISLAEAAWLYALFARLDKPLHGEMAATVRQLFKLLQSQRAALQPLVAPLVRPAHQEAPATTAWDSRALSLLAALNTLAAVTGKFFEQRGASEF